MKAIEDATSAVGFVVVVTVAAVSDVAGVAIAVVESWG